MIALLRRFNALFGRPVKVRLLLVLVGSLTIALAEAAAILAVLPLMALLTGATPRSSRELRILHDLFGQPTQERLAVYVALIVLAGFILKGLAALAIRWWSIGFVLRQGTASAAKLLDYYLRAPYALHLRRSTPDLLRVLNDGVVALHGPMVLGGVAVVTEVITILVLGTVLLVVNPLGTAVLGLYFGLSAWALGHAVKRRTRQAGATIIDSALHSNKAALHALGGIKEIKLRHEGSTFVNRYQAERLRAASAMRVHTFMGELPKYVLEMLFVIGVGITTAIAYTQDDPEAALGTVALVGIAGFRILPSVVRMMASINIVRGAVPTLDVIEPDLLAANSAAATGRQGPVARLPLETALELHEVRFRYEESKDDVLKGVSLTVPAGSSLAIVGGSGAGKTTLVDLILGLHRPSHGSVFADGKDVQTALAAWQSGLAMVPQDVFLLDESLRDNIRFTATPPADPDHLMDKVLAQAQLEDVVATAEHGLDTHVGERGTRLSGGQRQRIGIARALYREPTLLVLDEATSALDNETEHKVTATLDELRGQLTTIVVAHRLSTVRHCDQVVLLEDGRVRAKGTFTELSRTDEYFARLVSLGSLEG
ncbi:ABC transporter ATP-binding protein [Nocardioides flavus (ex Wang et al. 2016)]|uniref:ABC transporter ATP-binding protein n=1 Tax=Nocardioides flavus (ex Wang et al. 2016) TaxID=2058780 RepID=A0ABQ3HD01_9ACTN|nr:ABC transporter ATP-binding protein [Nocardioides flavus (ex Wang et al. 2016)]GHE14880.1 ABC transporter ATP-binding protein [Nocardioides flavus (ex Wang et al. 2016)]